MSKSGGGTDFARSAAAEKLCCASTIAPKSVVDLIGFLGRARGGKTADQVRRRDLVYYIDVV
jgi:hypothetical protein